MHRFVWSLALIAGFSVLGSADPSAAAASAKRCGEIARIGEAGPELVSVRAEGIRCRTARAVLSDQGRVRDQGWECHSAGQEAECEKGSASATYGASNARSCGSIGFEENTDYGAFGIVETHTACRTARAVARRSRDHGLRDSHRYSAKGFSCQGRAVDGVLPSLLYTCRKGRATVAFQR